MELIRAHYDPLGYIDLRVVPRHKIDSATRTVAITFELSEGVPCTIRNVEISGNETTQDRVIRRELYYPPLIPKDDLADGGKIRAIKPRLMNLDYFETVDVTPVATEREGEKDLDIRVAEKKTGMFQIGAGVSSEESVFGMLTVTQTNFDWRNRQNGFKGGGQRLLLQMRIGPQMSDIGVNFTEPWFRDRPLRMDLDLHRRERDQRYFTQTMTGAGVTFTRPLVTDAPEESEWRNWKQSYGYRYDYAQLGKFDSSTDAFLKDEKGGYSVSAVHYSIKRDTRDSFKLPTRGSLLQMTAEYAPSFLGSYSDIYRLDLQGTKYIPMRRWVLKLDAEVGAVDNLSGQSPALFDRWFAGGAGSIRGFQRRDVGPVDSHDNAAGGGSLMRGTVEAIYPIFDTFRASVWSDFGNVWSDAYGWNPGDLNASVGVGLQFELPGGIPVRLDYGFPVMTREPHLGKSGRFHFNVGYMF
jgi:outer membrane protein insertion porin family